MAYVLVVRARGRGPSRTEFALHEEAAAALGAAGRAGLRAELFRLDGGGMVLLAVMNMPRPKARDQ